MGVFLYSSRAINTARVEDVLRTRGHKNIKIEKSEDATLVHAGKILYENCNYLDAQSLSGGGQK